MLYRNPELRHELVSVSINDLRKALKKHKAGTFMRDAIEDEITRRENKAVRAFNRRQGVFAAKRRKVRS